MKYLIVILFLLPCAIVVAQEKKYIKKGNDLYNDKKYKEAEADYRK
jgi:Ca-activated chloride channel family protein